MPNLKKLETLKQSVSDAKAQLKAAYKQEGFIHVRTGDYDSTEYWYLHKSLQSKFDKEVNPEFERWFEEAQKEGLIQPA